MRLTLLQSLVALLTPLGFTHQEGRESRQLGGGERTQQASHIPGVGVQKAKPVPPFKHEASVTLSPSLGWRPLSDVHGVGGGPGGCPRTQWSIMTLFLP